MYRYDEFDHKFVEQRVGQFRDQVARRMSGDITEEQFRPLRLMNGLYLQLHAYMLRVAIPYGTVSGAQMRKLAEIARKFDKGYAHFTTRQNLQYNWPALKDTPDILAELASVEMHAIQTSGNCIRNVTADQFAGAAADEIEDPRIYAEIMRQWSTLHPEFSFLPRKFKIAVTGCENDRAAVRVHDIGLIMKRGPSGETGFEVLVGGGLGRTPMIAKTARDFIGADNLLSYLEAILRVYNQWGRRDNIYKARIKILVHELGIEDVVRRVDAEWARIKDRSYDLPVAERQRIAAYFAPPVFEQISGDDPTHLEQIAADPQFANWVGTNVVAHKQAGYNIVTISLKPIGGVPGDTEADQMDAVADLAERYSADEIRVSHEQNLVLPHVKQADLYTVWQALVKADLAIGNIGLVTDMITCPGLDYCNLANARSIPVAQMISERFAALDRQLDIGPLKLKISGCINACGHHHVGHIGILGVDRRGTEYYQISLGGSAEEDACLGDIVGPSFDYDHVTGAVETIIDTYVGNRHEGETFLNMYRRVGIAQFKEALYETA